MWTQVIAWGESARQAEGRGCRVKERYPRMPQIPSPLLPAHGFLGSPISVSPFSPEPPMPFPAILPPPGCAQLEELCHLTPMVDDLILGPGGSWM